MVPNWDSPVAFPCDVTTTYLLADLRNWAVARVRNPGPRPPSLAAEVPIAPRTSQSAPEAIERGLPSIGAFSMLWSDIRSSSELPFDSGSRTALPAFQGGEAGKAELGIGSRPPNGQQEEQKRQV